MRKVVRRLDMVQMAEDGGFNIVWAAEHHALNTIARTLQILTGGEQTNNLRLGTVVNAAYWHPIILLARRYLTCSGAANCICSSNNAN